MNSDNTTARFMGLNELFPGVWLVVKGFNPSAIASESVKI